jgi:hypothetical protein
VEDLSARDGERLVEEADDEERLFCPLVVEGRERLGEEAEERDVDLRAQGGSVSARSRIMHMREEPRQRGTHRGTCRADLELERAGERLEEVELDLALLLVQQAVSEDDVSGALKGGRGGKRERAHLYHLPRSDSGASPRYPRSVSPSPTAASANACAALAGSRNLVTRSEACFWCRTARVAYALLARAASPEAVRATRVGASVIGCEKPDRAIVLRRSRPRRCRLGLGESDEAMMRLRYRCEMALATLRTSASERQGQAPGESREKSGRTLSLRSPRRCRRAPPS